MRPRPNSAVMLGRRPMQWANDETIFGNPANTGHSPNAVSMAHYNMGVSLEVILYSTTHVGPRHVLAHTCQ